MTLALWGADRPCRFDGPAPLAVLPAFALVVIGRMEWPLGISADNELFALFDSASVTLLMLFSTLMNDNASNLLLVFRRWKGSPSPWCPRDAGGMLIATAPAASISPLHSGSSG